MAMGRPKIEIDKKQFENLCAIQCTIEEITAWFDCSHQTLERWCKREYKKTFGQVFDEKRRKGFISLRRKQYETALKGDKTLLIFLGKQYLGQKETPDYNNSEPIQIQIIR